MSRRIETIEQLAALPMNSIFVDRIGLAWQVTALGADWSHTKGHSDTRRNGFVQAGNHVVYEAAALASTLPVRVVDDGAPEPVAPASCTEPGKCPDGGRCHHKCSGPCFRVKTCVPLGGIFPGDLWPASVVADHAGDGEFIL